ncbi:proton-coupled zinc antiporter SLC30A1 isoform X2 [Palaemon carinicauda]|uniref:proton-coupled zinc antiporter SLC30A1 isoform X2 n=1 Tax=Palaemon carinicauda TaxID=392227 RepID=UPI0035B693A9
MGRYTGKKCRLLTMFTMTASFFVVELLVGYITNSMALVADSFHMLSDVLALVIAFLSVKMSPKKWSKNTFGWARAEVLGALVNSVFLMALCFSIFVESLNRLYEPEALHNPKLILIVGVTGLVVNLIGLGLFHQHGHGHSHGGHSHDDGGHGHSHRHQNKIVTINALVATDDNENDERFTPSSLSNRENRGKKESGASQMNMRGVFLHILSDALGSVIVIISALVVWLTDWEYSKYIDPGLSLCLVTLIGISTWPLLKDSALILLQTVPTHIQVDGIQKQLLNVDGVLAVHEFHVWQLAGERIIASAHIRCRNLKDYMVLAEKIKKMFHEEGIHSTTIQPEFVEFEDDNLSASIESAEDCILDCPSNDKDACAAQTCCGVSKQNDASPIASTCRQRTNLEANGENQPENSAEGAMEGGYLLVPTNVSHVSSV